MHLDVYQHDDVIKWQHFPRYWPFVRRIQRSPVNSRHKGQWRGALMFSLICAWINGWINNGEAGGLRRYRGHYDVTVMSTISYIKHVLCFQSALSLLGTILTANSRHDPQVFHRPLMNGSHVLVLHWSGSIIKFQIIEEISRIPIVLPE